MASRKLPLKKLAPSWQKPITSFFVPQSQKPNTDDATAESHAEEPNETEPLLKHNSQCLDSNENTTDIRIDNKAIDDDKENVMDVSEKNEELPDAELSSSSDSLDKSGNSSSSSSGGLSSESEDVVSESSDNEIEQTREKNGESCADTDKNEMHQFVQNREEEANKSSKSEYAPPVVTEISGKKAPSKKIGQKPQKIARKRPLLRVMIGAKHRQLKVAARIASASEEN